MCLDLIITVLQSPKCLISKFEILQSSSSESKIWFGSTTKILKPEDSPPPQKKNHNSDFWGVEQFFWKALR